MQTTLLARIGASSRTSASGQLRPVNVGLPNGCSAISFAMPRLGVALDADEGDSIGTGDSTETHCLSLVPVPDEPIGTACGNSHVPLCEK